jgi:hypothetical protein
MQLQKDQHVQQAIEESKKTKTQEDKKRQLENESGDSSKPSSNRLFR